MPTDFVDPSGLLRIQQCTRQWWTDADGNRQYSSWSCVTIYDDGGGGGGNPGSPNSNNSGSLDETYWECVRNFVGRHLVETVKNVAAFEAGKGLVVAGLLLGRFFVRHAGRAPSSGLPGGTAINNLSSIKEVGITPVGLIGAGVGLMGYGIKSQYNSIRNMPAEGKRCEQLRR